MCNSITWEIGYTLKIMVYKGTKFIHIFIQHSSSESPLKPHVSSMPRMLSETMFLVDCVSGAVLWLLQCCWPQESSPHNQCHWWHWALVAKSPSFHGLEVQRSQCHLRAGAGKCLSCVWGEVWSFLVFVHMLCSWERLLSWWFLLLDVTAFLSGLCYVFFYQVDCILFKVILFL